MSRTRAFLRTALVVLASLSLTAGAFAGIGPAAAATTVYQAENATIFQGVVESNHAGYTGTGFVNYGNIAGSYVEWTVSAAQTGSARLTFPYANGGTTNRPMDITVNGTLAADELAFPPTGAWSSWQTSSTTATLNAGANTIRATATSASGGPNVDSLEVTDPTGSDVTLTVGSTSGALLRDDFIGLSFEADVIASPGLAAGNLAQYLKTLGPGVMRFGGNNVDKTFWTSSGEPTPSWAIARLTPTDLERLNTLAVASGWKVPVSKAGIVVANDITAPARGGYAVLGMSAGNGVEFMWDGNGDGRLDGWAGGGASYFPVWLKLVRAGSSYTAYASEDGHNWKQVRMAQVPSTQGTGDAGMFASAVNLNNPGAVNTAMFDGFAVS